mgnify:CR=1 FL=1
MDDTESKMSEEVRGFKEKIEKSLNIECKLHDERLSSFEAKEQKEIIKKKYKDFNKFVKPSCLNLDPSINPNWAKKNLKNVVLQGGLDPKILQTDKET